MIMRPYLTHGSPGEIPAGEEIVRPDGNNVGGPSHAAYTDCIAQRRAGVIPPIIKLLSCGWHPRATRGTRSALHSRPHSAMFSAPLPYSFFPFLPPLPLALPILSVRFSLVDPPLIVRRDEDARANIVTRDFELAAEKAFLSHFFHHERKTQRETRR